MVVSPSIVGLTAMMISAISPPATRQRVHMQGLGAHAFQGGDYPAQHVVEPAVLAGLLDGHHVADAFHHAKQRAVAPVVAADLAMRPVRQMVAFLTKLDIAPHVQERFAQAFRHPELWSRTRCSTRRSAVFLPMLGRAENACTASSMSFDE